MPLYDYRCKNCDETFDEFRPIEKRRTCRCVKCGKTAQQQLSPVRIDYYNMGVSLDFPTAAEKWAKMHRNNAKREYD